jgi:Ca2+-binding EF-hand superfamily protein
MQTGMSSKQALFKSIDKNGDGNISQDEMKSWMESLDTDGNGALSDAEWAAAP